MVGGILAARLSGLGHKWYLSLVDRLSKTKLGLHICKVKFLVGWVLRLTHNRSGYLRPQDQAKLIKTSPPGLETTNRYLGDAAQEEQTANLK